MPKVDPARVKELMNRRGLALKQLVRPGLSLRTIARCRTGDGSVRPRAIEALAKALGVEPGVLTGDLPMPFHQAGPDQPASDLWVRLSADIFPWIRNAYSLVARRYRVPYTRIVELAPLLFTLVAERSLRERREAKIAVEEATGRLRSLGGRLPHLPVLATCPHNAQDWALGAEENSIAAKDIFASQVDSDPDLADYVIGEDGDNPFVATLKRMAEEISEPVEINTVDESWVSYDDLCRSDALALAGNEDDLAAALLSGHILIKDIPRELFADDRTEERIAWLRERHAALPEHPVSDPLDDVLGQTESQPTAPDTKGAGS